MTIAELSDDPKYTIKSVAAQTGILPVTLRAWERRHELLSPHRLDNHYRLYSERDIAVLRWIKNRLDQGLTISIAIQELREMQRNDLWPEVMPEAPTSSPSAFVRPAEEYAHGLYEALIHHDESRAGELLREILAGYPLLDAFTRILVPALVKIGEAWYHGEIRVTTEHFASAYLRGKLLNLFQAYPTRRGAPFLLVGCGPDEQHELGSLMLAVLLRAGGYRVEYLGPDIPLDDLVDYAKYEKPVMIILSASSEAAAMELKKLQEKLSKLCPAPLFGYGGGAFNQNPALCERIPGYFLGDKLEVVPETITALLKTSNR
jgi:DNA-binding transcriptional MerR regulator/methylmalonyl-CoA mutase cobalamin-binding subunit